MKKLIIFLTVILSFTFCKGPGSGPLVRDSSAKTDINKTMGHQTNKSNVAVEKKNVVVEPCEGCITISNLLANKKSYTGKVVKVKGKVTKYNPEIMGKNWVHIQDGSEFEGGFDLTITTDKKAAIGEDITFEGKIVLDKDFGYGYFYSVLMEDGKPILKGN
jgi:predicted acyltransferase (DUF342 family)